MPQGSQKLCNGIVCTTANWSLYNASQRPWPADLQLVLEAGFGQAASVSGAAALPRAADARVRPIFLTHR